MTLASIKSKQFPSSVRYEMPVCANVDVLSERFLCGCCYPARMFMQSVMRSEFNTLMCFHKPSVSCTPDMHQTVMISVLLHGGGNPNGVCLCVCGRGFMPLRTAPLKEL